MHLYLTPQTPTNHRAAAAESHLDNPHPPGLHPAFGPQRLDLGLQEGLEVVLHRQRALLLHLVAAELHSHQVAEQVPVGRQEVDLQPEAPEEPAEEPGLLT